MSEVDPETDSLFVVQNPEEVLGQLPKLTVEEAQSIKNVVIVATPSVAHVLERKTFLQSIIASIYSASDIASSQALDSPDSYIEIKSLAAIVDALPYRETSSARLRDSEGLSILFSSDSVYIEPALPGLAGDDTTNYTVTFTSENDPEPRFSILGQRPLASRYVTLPVANTFFVNGHRATLVEDTWKVSIGSNTFGTNEERGRLVPTISHERRQDLQTATIHAGFQSNALGRSELPLTPLTTPRPITKAMGNVVTEIQLPERKAPASTELESSVSRYIADHPGATSAGPLLIYASVRPRPVAMSPHQVPSPPLLDRLHSRDLIDTFEGCTRLFRVTGGGGGWGKKQGLLSLDPAVGFDGDDQGTTSSFPTFEDADDDDISQVLSEPKGMMPLGSTIQFWVWDKWSSDDHGFPGIDMEIQGRGPRQGSSGTDKMHLVLGTGPRAEEREGIEGQERAVLERSEIRQHCLHGYFGMLSYGGAAVGSVDMLEQSTEGRPMLYKGARSRVDVPNTTFVLDVGSSTRNAS